MFSVARPALAHLKKQGGVIINSAQTYMYIVFLIATVALLIPTLLPMLRYEVWWVRGFDFHRLQLCFLLLVLLLLELFMLDLREPVAIVLPAVGRRGARPFCPPGNALAATQEGFVPA